MIHARRSPPSPDFFDNASTAKRVAGVSRLILHAPIDFLRFEDLLAVGKSDADALADCVLMGRRTERFSKRQISAAARDCGMIAPPG